MGERSTVTAVDHSFRERARVPRQHDTRYGRRFYVTFPPLDKPPLYNLWGCNTTKRLRCDAGRTRCAPIVRRTPKGAAHPCAATRGAAPDGTRQPIVAQGCDSSGVGLLMCVGVRETPHGVCWDLDGGGAPRSVVVAGSSAPRGERAPRAQPAAVSALSRSRRRERRRSSLRPPRAAPRAGRAAPRAMGPPCRRREASSAAAARRGAGRASSPAVGRAAEVSRDHGRCWPCILACSRW